MLNQLKQCVQKPTKISFFQRSYVTSGSNKNRQTIAHQSSNTPGNSNTINQTQNVKLGIGFGIASAIVGAGLFQLHTYCKTEPDSKICETVRDFLFPPRAS